MREIECCQEESTEDVLGKDRSKTRAKKSIMLQFLKDSFPLRSHPISPWAEPRSGLSGRELLPLKSRCFWLKVIREKKNGGENKLAGDSDGKLES